MFRDLKLAHTEKERGRKIQRDDIVWIESIGYMVSNTAIHIRANIPQEYPIPWIGFYNVSM
jgi:hypothetical protein